MDRDEREQLEASSLGELPVSKRTERGELYTVDRDRPIPGPGGTFQLPSSFIRPAPRDVINQNRALVGAEAAPQIAEENPFLVTTTWDALPINAQQFVHTDLVNPQLEPFGNGAAILQGTVTFTVPTGVNGVLRGIRWEAGQIINEEAFTVTLLVRGSVHRTYEGLRIGQALAEFFPVYALAGPEQSFTLQFDIEANTGPVGYSPPIRAWLIGQLLLDTGKELQYEPANEKPRVAPTRTRETERRS